MISGTVNLHREAVLRVIVLDTKGNRHPTDFVADTGFDRWISLPPNAVSTLGLRWQRFGHATLADGSDTMFDIYEAEVLWDGQRRMIPVYEMDADPLVGMSLMYGYELVLPILDGASFTLRSIANP